MGFNPEKRAYLLEVFGDEERVRRIEEHLEELAKSLEDAGVAFKDNIGEMAGGAHTFAELDQQRHVGELLAVFRGISLNILSDRAATPEAKEKLLVAAAQEFAARVALKKANKALGGRSDPVQPYVDQLARSGSGAKENEALQGLRGPAADFVRDLLAGRVVR